MSKGKPFGVLVPTDLVGPILRLWAGSVVVVVKEGFPVNLEEGEEAFEVSGKGMYRGPNARLWVRGRSLRIRDLTTNAAVRLGPRRVPADRGSEGSPVRDKTLVVFGQRGYVFFRLP